MLLFEEEFEYIADGDHKNEITIYDYIVGKNENGRILSMSTTQGSDISKAVVCSWRVVSATFSTMYVVSRKYASRRNASSLLVEISH